MSSNATSPGAVFISYAREDQPRVAPLVEYLAGAGLNVWWDKNILVGTSFRSAIQKSLDEAACVVVVWTAMSVEKEFVRSEASLGQARGHLLPVLLDAGARVPVGFTEVHHLDLTRWDGSDAAALEPLIGRISALAARGPDKLGNRETLRDRGWVVDNSQRIVADLQVFAVKIRSIGDLLATDSGPAADLKGALGEVGKTYRAVNSAVLRFVMPIVGAGAIDPAPYLAMERGSLKSEIETGRGHCGLILTHYGRHGGLRDSIEGKMSPPDLEAVDAAFARLGTADGDLFIPLVEIGEVLTNESRVIANLLLAGQEDAARKRILEGRMKLAPLEAQLSAVMQEFQVLEASLGYAALP